MLQTAALAQAAPAQDSGSQELLRQQERERALRQLNEQTPDVRLEKPPVTEATRLPQRETPCFQIHDIVLVGDAAAEFQWATAAANDAPDGEKDPAIARCLGADSINLVMKRIQNAIVKHGYVTTRVLAEPQDLNSGVLRLTVVPGRVGQIRFADGTSPRATKWNAVPATTGDLLNLRDIEQALENFRRVPTATADIQIVPSEGPNASNGESDLVVGWQQSFPFRLNVSIDDSGSRSTGKYLGGITLFYDHWWTLNDLFYVNLNQDLGGSEAGSRGTRGYTVHYSLPFGNWQLGLTASSNTYHQSVAGVNQTYVYSGESDNSEVKLSRLFYRDASRKTSIFLRGWTRSSKNFIDDTEVLVQRRRMAGWDIGFNHREFIGSATLDANLSYRQGTGAMDALPAPEETFNEGTSRPRMILADAQLTLPFKLAQQAFRYIANWRIQSNHTPLVPQDRFSIGGRYTVRGFDGETLLSAERGWLWRNDLGVMLGQTGQELYLGIDYGEVGGPSRQYLLGTHLAGAVIGLRGGYRGLSYDVFTGKPLSKPSGFKTASSVTGFNLNLSF